MVGLFVLSTSLTALPPSHCLDSCVYNKVTTANLKRLAKINQVRDIRRTKYCFSSGESPTAATTCHRKMPSLATLMDRSPSSPLSSSFLSSLSDTLLYILSFAGSLTSTKYPPSLTQKAVQRKLSKIQRQHQLKGKPQICHPRQCGSG